MFKKFYINKKKNCFSLRRSAEAHPPLRRSAKLLPPSNLSRRHPSLLLQATNVARKLPQSQRLSPSRTQHQSPPSLPHLVCSRAKAGKWTPPRPLSPLLVNNRNAQQNWQRPSAPRASLSMPTPRATFKNSAQPGSRPRRTATCSSQTRSTGLSNFFVQSRWAGPSSPPPGSRRRSRATSLLVRAFLFFLFFFFCLNWCAASDEQLHALDNKDSRAVEKQYGFKLNESLRRGLCIIIIMDGEI